MRSCALCRVPAKTFCESDQAALCWDCDAKVHGANFLVARHSRTLLCHACQCPTPWTASGTKLGHTVSVCDDCVNKVQATDRAEEGSGGNDDDMPGDGDADDTDDGDLPEDENDGGDEGSGEDEGGSDGGGNEDGDNQVVPWSPLTPPPAATSSSSDESLRWLYSGGNLRMTSSSKRRQEVSADLWSQVYSPLPCSVLFLGHVSLLLLIPKRYTLMDTVVVLQQF